MLEHCCGDLLPFRHKDVPIHPNVFDGVEVRALCRPVNFFHTDLDKPFLYGPRFVHRGIVMLKQERASGEHVSENAFPLLQSPMAVCFTPL